MDTAVSFNFIRLRIGKDRNKQRHNQVYLYIIQRDSAWTVKFPDKLLTWFDVDQLIWYTCI